MERVQGAWRNRLYGAGEEDRPGQHSKSSRTICGGDGAPLPLYLDRLLELRSELSGTGTSRSSQCLLLYSLYHFHDGGSSPRMERGLAARRVPCLRAAFLLLGLLR